ncbi:MAG: DUF4384 domain-containing protein, partial [FCB group bacterium]|nr:DUF4384 domain-containing protein [FCB group bacterium]
LVDAPVFDFRSILPPASQTGGAVSTRTLLVKLDHQLHHLRTRVDALDRIHLVDHGYHLRLTTEDDGLVALYHPSGDRIDGGYHPGSPARLLARLSRQVLVQELVDLSLPGQRFNVHLDLSGDSGFLLLGERFDVTVESDLPAYLLLLNVGTTGAVTVLYPIARDELRARTFMREKHEVNP